jgi:hypothetical protein
LSKYGIQRRRIRRVERVWKGVAVLLFIVVIIELNLNEKNRVSPQLLKAARVPLRLKNRSHDE